MKLCGNNTTIARMNPLRRLDRWKRRMPVLDRHLVLGLVYEPRIKILIKKDFVAWINHSTAEAAESGAIIRVAVLLRVGGEFGVDDASRLQLRDDTKPCNLYCI